MVFENVDIDLINHSEKQVLASIAQYPQITYNVVKVLQADDFTQANHRILYGIIKHKFDKAIANGGQFEINPIIVQLELSNIGADIQISDFIELATDDNDFVVSIAEQLKQMSLKRKLSSGLSKVSLVGKKELSEAIDEVKKLVNTIENELVYRNVNSYSIYEGGLQALEYIEDPSEVRIYRFGVPDIDKDIIDFAPGNTIVIGASPGVGKTSIAAYLSVENAKNNIPVHFFSMEMPQTQLHARFLSIISGISSELILKKELNEQQKSDLKAAIYRVKNMPLRLTSVFDMRLSAVVQGIKDSKLNYGTEIFVLDYLQLIQYEARQRNQEVAYIAQTMKNLANELGVAIVELSQLTRNNKEEPTMSDLKESGDIEQAASLIALMWNDNTGILKEKMEMSTHSPVNPVWFKVDKQRNGKKFRQLLAFNGEKMRFATFAID